MSSGARQLSRCWWATGDPLMIAYHDTEWGTPTHHDRALFELLVLEGAQAGLSWLTILRKRAAYRAAFARFNPEAVARFDAAQRRALLRNPGLVRNKMKIDSAVTNARALLAVRDEFGSSDAYLWRFVHGAPLRRVRRTPRDVPAETPESQAMSKDLRRRGFTFVGPTICYAFMQAAGLVDDHLVSCFRAGRPRA